MITPEWFLWYGLKIGLTYKQTFSIPHGELMDLIAVEQIKHEGAKLVITSEDEFWELLNRR